MSFHSSAWYINFGDGATTGYYALPQWAQGTYAAGVILRQKTATPVLNAERVFICIVGGASGSVEPSWVTTKGALTIDGAVTWQECSGMAAINGDATHTPKWQGSGAGAAPNLGDICQDVAGTTFFICNVAGNQSSVEPAWHRTLGQTTTDGSATWTSIGSIASQTKWAAPIPRLENAFGLNSTTVLWGGPGDDFYIADIHAQTATVATTIGQFWGVTGGSTTPFVYAPPTRMLCVSHLGNVPPQPSDLTTGASISMLNTVGACPLLQITSGYGYWYGVTLNGGVGASSGGSLDVGSPAATPGADWVYEKCAFNLQSTSASATLNICKTVNTDVASGITWINCSTSWSNVNQFLVIGGCSKFVWKDSPNAIVTTRPGSVVPNNLWGSANNGQKNGLLMFEGIDLSAMPGPLVGTATFNTNSGQRVYFNNCKINPNVVVARSPTLGGPANGYHPEQTVYLNVCDYAARNYRQEKWGWAGTVKLDALPPTIYRNGGATDGLTPISWQMTTNSNANFLLPLSSNDIVAWCSVKGSPITASIPISGPSNLKTGDVWLEAVYLGNASYPLGSRASSGLATTLTPNTTPLTPDVVSSWANGFSQNYMLSVTFTPQMAGPVAVTVKLAKPSTVINVDPKLQGIS